MTSNIGKLKKIVLLMEDNSMNRELAIMQLKKFDFTVHVATNGREAFEAATRSLRFFFKNYTRYFMGRHFLNNHCKCNIKFGKSL